MTHTLALIASFSALVANLGVFFVINHFAAKRAHREIQRIRTIARLETAIRGTK